MSAIYSLDALKFDNSFYNKLPADPVINNNSRHVDSACYSKVAPMPFPKASLVAFSRDMALELGLNPTECMTPRFTEVFSGTKPLSDMQTFAACYGGHQFGNWAGQLGDGRAISLGEIVNNNGQRWALQLKGSGPTPYSRHADGFAVLRSSIREFLCSEAMHYLRVPTTRALSLMDTGTQVERDMFYNGQSKMEPGAIVCRAAPTFIRFGNFELFTSRNQIDITKQLADYTIEYFFPHLGKPSKEIYLQWFHEICLTTARMITEWMRVGFVHGVMNTDNMSILGLTIDYGPYGWLEDYDPHWTPNTTDAGGRRYAFGKQPEIALWNLLQLANAIYPIVEDSKGLENALKNYKKVYDVAWRDMMTSKLGLLDFEPENDEVLFQDLVRNLKNTETDMTLFFRHLSKLELNKKTDVNQLLSIIEPAFYADTIESDEANNIKTWLLQYVERLKKDDKSDEDRRQQMNAVNPLYVLRNYLAQEAIEQAEAGSYTMIHELQEVLKNPYEEQEGRERFAQKRPDWAKSKAGASMLSCSS